MPMHLSPSRAFFCKGNGTTKVNKENTENPRTKNAPEDKKWKNLAPFLNAYVKVFPASEPNKKSIWMLVWVKEDSVISHDYPVPKKSLVYKHLTNKSSEKQKVLEECEDKLVEAYTDAKNFIAEDKDVQTGFEIVGRNDFVMTVRGGFGIEVGYPYVDLLLKNIKEGNNGRAETFQRFFTGVFAHEMTHYIRSEFEEEANAGKEIASHAVQFLSGLGNSPLADARFEEVIEEPEDLYDIDMICSLKVVQSLLLRSCMCAYKPKSFEPSELNKAILSIPECERENTIKRMAGIIIGMSPVDLMRTAADVTMVPFDRSKKDLVEKAG